MYSTASLTVVIFSASSSGTSIPNASSNAITNSTWSSESAPRSSTNDAVGVTSASSTPSCSTIICFTRSSTLAIPISSVPSGSGLFHRTCTPAHELPAPKLLQNAVLAPQRQPAHSRHALQQGQLEARLGSGAVWRPETSYSPFGLILIWILAPFMCTGNIETGRLAKCAKTRDFAIHSENSSTSPSIRIPVD